MDSLGIWFGSTRGGLRHCMWCCGASHTSGRTDAYRSPTSTGSYPGGSRVPANANFYAGSSRGCRSNPSARGYSCRRSATNAYPCCRQTS